MSVPARYPGSCSECGERWKVGDLIKSRPVGAEHVLRWEHATCPESIDPTTRLPYEKACPDCWLVHPEGACDR